MDTIKRTHKQQKPYNSKIYSDYFGGLKVAILDIETTGLNPKYSKVILGGLLIPGESVLAVTQYFANNKNEEKELLQAYCTALSKADVLISYNGCSFDIPFLKSRLMYHGLDIDIESNQCFDLYRALHFYSRFRDFLPNLKQKTVEAYLGIAESRNDGISGRESVTLYDEYCKNGSPEAKEKILLHNYDDLIQLARLRRVLDKLDLHKILHCEGFTVAVGYGRIFTRNISFGRKMLKISALTKNIPYDYYSFETGFQAVHLAASHNLTLEIPYEKLYGTDYVDLDNIPLDFSELHKSPHFKNQYLIIRENDQICYAEVNKLLKTVFSEILKFY